MYPHVRQLTTRSGQLEHEPQPRTANPGDRRLTRARAWLLAAAAVATVAVVDDAAKAAEAASGLVL
jgi:predicted Zn-dependent protease